MINCSVHNYKEWMEAYLNGDLNREDMLTADAFLQKNPRILDQYLLELEELSLVPENISHPLKNELNITIQSTKNITIENVAEYFVGYHEGSLSNDERNELESFILINPKLKKEFDLYGAALLIPNKSITFPNKNELLKRARPTVPLFWRISAAASILIVLGLWLFWPVTYASNGLALGAFNNIQFTKGTKQNDLVVKQSSERETLADNSPTKYRVQTQKANQNRRIARDPFVLVEMQKNQPIELEVSTNNQQLALQSVPDVGDHSVSPFEVVEKPKKKGFLNKIFSGEQLYVEDYVNATFSAFKNNKEDEDKWVLKVERDNKGKSKKVKFTSPIFSFRTKN